MWVRHNAVRHVHHHRLRNIPNRRLRRHKNHRHQYIHKILHLGIPELLLALQGTEFLPLIQRKLHRHLSSRMCNRRRGLHGLRGRHGLRGHGRPCQFHPHRHCNLLYRR